MLASFAPAFGAEKSPPFTRGDLDAAHTLRERALADTTGWQLVESLTTEVGARFAGSEGDRAAVAWAEREMRREDRRKQMAESFTDDMATKLRLNEQQKAKVLEIAQKFMSEISRIWEQGDGGARRSRSERRAELRRLQEQSEQALRGVLDSGQQRAYEALDDEDKLGFPRRRDGGRGDGNRGAR